MSAIMGPDGYGVANSTECLDPRDARIADLEAENARIQDICEHQRSTLYFLEGSEDGAELHATDARREEIADLRAKLAAAEALVRELAGLLTTLMDTGIDPGMYLVDGITAALAKVPKEGRHG